MLLCTSAQALKFLGSQVGAFFSDFGFARVSKQATECINCHFLSVRPTVEFIEALIVIHNKLVTIQSSKLKKYKLIKITLTSILHLIEF